MKKIAISVPLVSVLNDIFIFLEYETLACFIPEDTESVNYENLLGVCEDGEKAYWKHIYIRCGLHVGM